MLGHFSNLKNLIKIPPLCNWAAQAAEIFVERRYRTSHHNSIQARNAENESGEEKMKKKRRRGEEKKKEEEKGGERKKEGKSLFLQGLYVLSTYIVLF